MKIEVSQDYRALRRDAYPPLAEQLDALWKGGAEAEAMDARIKAIKAQFPKGETVPAMEGDE